jgi:hypothetical protein
MRWAYAAVTLFAALVIATGCGSAKEVVKLETITNAAAKTEEVGTARISFQGSVTFNHDHEQRYEFKGRGVVDWTTGSAEFSAVYKYPNALQEFIKAQFGGPATADFVLDQREGIVLYVRFPFLKKQMPKGKSWLKADIVEIGKAYGLDLDRLKETRRTNPEHMLDYLESAVGVRRIGTDLVRREVTTHYSTVVKAETIVEQSPKDQQKAMRKYLRLMGVKTYPVDIWVDRDGVVRKLAIELEYKLPDGDYVKMKASEEYFDFGVEVNIKPPPPKSVIDVTKCFCPDPDRHTSRRLTS